MPTPGETIPATIRSTSSSVEDGIAFPERWGQTHLHIKSNHGMLYRDEIYIVEILREGNGYWIGETVEPIDLDPLSEFSDDGETEQRVYWVSTSKSYCYHTSYNCPRLNKHEGEIRSATLERLSGDIPDAVNDRRPCPSC